MTPNGGLDYLQQFLAREQHYDAAAGFRAATASLGIRIVGGAESRSNTKMIPCGKVCSAIC